MLSARVRRRGASITWMGYSLVVQASWVPALKSFPLSPKTRRLKLASMAIHDDDAWTNDTREESKRETTVNANIMEKKKMVGVADDELARDGGSRRQGVEKDFKKERRGLVKESDE